MATRTSDAVRDDWCAANARLHGSDSARAVAGLLRRLADVAESIAGETAAGEGRTKSGRVGGWDTASDGQVARPEAWVPANGSGGGDTSGAGPIARGRGTPVWLERAPGEAGPGLVDTLVSDLADAAVATLDPFWGVVERGPGEMRNLPVEARARELLALLRRVLARHGIAQPPPFVRHPERRAAPPALLEVGGDHLAQVLRAGHGPDGVVLLCAAEQARLLSRDPAAARWIRFAPDSSRPAVSASVGEAWQRFGPDARPTRAAGRASQWAEPVDDVLWTSTGPFAGVLRLTPVRRDAVVIVRPRHNRVGENRP